METWEPNIERYCVDYIKMVIKSKDSTERDKFNALLLLKDLLKTKQKNLILYNDQKLLARLYKLASSPLREKVLLQYNERGDLTYSKKFYYLLRECFSNWGKNFDK